MIDSYEEKVKKFWVLLIATIIIVPLGAIYSGFVMTYLWGWFIVPITGLNPITIVQAIGFQFFVGCISIARDNKKDKEWGEEVAIVFIKPTMFLFMGYIVSLFL